MRARIVERPVRPDELLDHVLEQCAHPTTLVIAGTSGAFVQSCVEGTPGYAGRHGVTATTATTAAVASLRQIAVARHIRVVFAPTVAHLRACLAAFDPAASRVPPPPPSATLSPAAPRSSYPTLVVYGLLRLHRGTSEWSAQGLGASAAVLVEAGWRAGLEVVVVEDEDVVDSDDDDGGDDNEDSEAAVHAHSRQPLDQRLPVLSTAPRRQMQRAGYPLSTVRVRDALRRWFVFEPALADGGVVQGEAVGAKACAPPESTEAGTESPTPAQTHQCQMPATAPPIRTHVKDSEDEDDVSVCSGTNA